MSKIKHIIWDWNGTLINDTWLCHELLNVQLVKHGLQTLALSEYRNTFDFPIIDVYRQLGFDFNKTPYDEIAASYHKDYSRRRTECTLHPHAIETLDWAKDNRISCSVLSAYLEEYLLEIIDHYNISQYFEHITGLDDTHGKSKIHKGRDLIDRLEFPSEDIMLIGDSVHDFEVAGALKVRCILFSGGHTSEERLKRCSAPVIDSLEIVPSIIGRQ